MNQPAPIIIDITEPPENALQGLADVLVGALGVAGALVFVAALLGLMLGALLFWYRSGNPLSRS